MSRRSSIKLDAPAYELIPGLRKMERHQYDALPAVNWSSLKPYSSCPLKGKWAEDHRPDNDNLRFGRLYHEFILEPDVFVSHCIRVPDFGYLRKHKDTTSEQAKRNKMDKRAWEQDNTDKEWVDGDTYAQLVAMREALYAHPVAKSALTQPGTRKEYACLSEKNGVWYKSLFDMIGDGWITDLKTCRDASPKGFGQSIAKWGYLGQAAFYVDGHKRGFGSALGADDMRFCFIAQEKDPPYAVGVYTLNSRHIQSGRVEYKRLLFLKQQCDKAGQYPAYTPEVAEDADVPEWALIDAF